MSDFIIVDGDFVFTKEYHLKRGYCCKNKCMNCPWGYGSIAVQGELKEHNVGEIDASDILEG